VAIPLTDQPRRAPSGSTKQCLLPRRFTRTHEDFRCAQCGRQVASNGYTNHCPVCLWSMHVDVYPGDWSATCRGLMRAIGLLYERGEFVLVHECVRCGLRRRNRAAFDDDLGKLLE
jgi:RNHCP domain